MFTCEIDSCSEQQWNDLLPLFADANIYQTWAYGALSWSEKQLSHLVLRRGNEPVAAAQVRIITVPVLGSGVAYVRWGPMWQRRGQTPDPAVLKGVSEAIHQEYVKKRKLVLRVIPNEYRDDPAGETIRATWTPLGFSLDASAPSYRTFIVDLAPSLEAIRKAFDPKWRNKLSGAERNGLTIEEGTSRAYYDQFLEVYREMMARKQFSTTVDVEEFGDIQERLPEQLRMRIFLGRKEGRTPNALVVTAVGDRAIYILGATSDEGTKTKGSYLLHWRAMQWLKELGVRWYDLGGINPETNPGVFEFKQGFSGRDVTQLGRFECRESWLSSAVLEAAERIARARSKHSAD